MRVYIVTKNDYRYANGRFFPVDTFGADIKYALNHMNIFVGVYDSFSAAEAAVDEDIRFHFNINEIIDYYNSSIRIEKHYFADSNWEEIDVILPDSDRVNQIQMIYNINIKDFENPEEATKKLSEKEENDDSKDTGGQNT